jgi:hypothetical protein
MISTGQVALHSIEAVLHREGATGRSISIEKGEIAGTVGGGSKPAP